MQRKWPMIMGFICASRLDPPHKPKISTLLGLWSSRDWMSGAPTRQTSCLLSPGRTTCPRLFLQCNFLRKNPSNSQSDMHYIDQVYSLKLLNNALWECLVSFPFNIMWDWSETISTFNALILASKKFHTFYVCLVNKIFFIKAYLASLH